MLEEAMRTNETSGGRTDTNRPEELKEMQRKLTEKHIFKPGQLVMWKDGLKHVRVPRYGEPIIVTQVLDKPVMSEGNVPGSPYWGEKYDIVAGTMLDGNFVEFHYDSRRFRPFEREPDQK